MLLCGEFIGQIYICLYDYVCLYAGACVFVRCVSFGVTFFVMSVFEEETISRGAIGYDGVTTDREMRNFIRAVWCAFHPKGKNAFVTQSGNNKRSVCVCLVIIHFKVILALHKEVQVDEFVRFAWQFPSFLQDC